MTDSQGEAMRSCQDALSAASERNPLKTIVVTINDKGQLQVTIVSDLASASWMLQSLQASVQDLIRKDMRL